MQVGHRLHYRFFIKNPLSPSHQDGQQHLSCKIGGRSYHVDYSINGHKIVHQSRMIEQGNEAMIAMILSI